MAGNAFGKTGIVSSLTLDLRPKLLECMFKKIHTFATSNAVRAIPLYVVCAYKCVFAYVFPQSTSGSSSGLFTLLIEQFLFCCCIKILWQKQPRGEKVYFKLSISHQSLSLQEIEIANHIHNQEQKEKKHRHSYAQLTFSTPHSSRSPCLGNNATLQWVGLLLQLMYKNVPTGQHDLHSSRNCVPGRFQIVSRFQIVFN